LELVVQFLCRLGYLLVADVQRHDYRLIRCQTDRPDHPCIVVIYLDGRPGVKFKDADLLGIPVRVTIGPKGLADGNIEIKLRNSADIQTIPADQGCQRVWQVIQTLLKELQPGS